MNWRRLNIIILFTAWLPTLPLIWLLGTEHGLQWLLARSLPPALSIERVEGALMGPIRIEGLHYQDASLALRVDEARIDWRLSQLLLGELYIKRLQVQGLHLQSHAAGAGGNGSMPDVNLPLKVALRELTLRDVSFDDGDGSPLRLDYMRAALSVDESGLHLDEVMLEGPDVSAQISGFIEPRGEYRHSLSVDLDVAIPAWQRLAGRGQLIGELSHSRFVTDLRTPARGKADIELIDVLTDFKWRLQLSMEPSTLNQLYASWPALVVSGEGKAAGDLTQMQVESLTLAALDGRLAAHGELAWAAGLQWFVELDSQGLNPEALWAEFPGRLDVRAFAGGRHDPNQPSNIAVEIERMQGQLRGNAISLQSGVEISGDRVLIAHSELRSAESQFTIKGVLGEKYDLHWQLTSPALEQLHPSLAGRLQARGAVTGTRTQPRLLFVAEGSGLRHDETQLTQIDVDGDWLFGGQGDGHLRLELAELRLAEDDFHWLLAQLSPQAPALQAMAERLRQQPLKLKAEATMHGAEINIQRFDVQLPNMRLALSGRVGDEWDLAWTFNSQALAQLYPGLAGILDLRGGLKGAAAAPRLSLDFEARQLVYNDGEQASMATQLQGRVGLNLFSWQDLSLNLDGREMYVAGETMAALRINASGDLAQHRISAHMTRATYASGISVRGGYQEAQGWRGELSSSDFISPRWGRWQQQQATALTWRDERLDLAQTCWLSGDSRLCLQGAGGAADWQGELQLALADLELVNKLMPVDLSFHQGRLDLALSAAKADDGSVSGSVDMDLAEGSISYPLMVQERGHWQFKFGSLRGKFDRQGLRSKVDIQLVGGDGIQGHLNLPGFELLAFAGDAQALDVQARANITDLGLLNNLLDEIFGVEGNIELEALVKGSLGKPKIDGRLSLKDGRLQVPRLGLNISELVASAESTGGERAEYTLSGVSGGGRFAATGETVLDAARGWETKVQLTGERVEVSHIPEAHVFVDPDLKLRVKHRELWLDGEVKVAEARLQPKDLAAAESVSDDVVIIGEDEPPPPPWLIHNRLRLTLSQPVYLYGFGFEGKIAGSLSLVDEPGRPTLANGELNVVEGRYQAYGQNLTVEQGRLMFAGGPVANPALDLRAVRKVDTVTAGIRVRGLLRQPEFELFSSPAMGQTDILGYLVMGRPLDNTATSSEGAMMAQAALAIGLKGGDFLARSVGDRFGLEEMRIDTSGGGDQASLLMGRYLSPRLYVGYGVGLLDAVNTLHLRYQLSSNWQLKAESGEAQSADFIFSIER